MASYSSKLAHLNTWRETPADVRFGSKADICSAKWHVRFTPRKQACAAHKVMSAKCHSRTSRVSP